MFYISHFIVLLSGISMHTGREGGQNDCCTRFYDEKDRMRDWFPIKYMQHTQSMGGLNLIYTEIHNFCECPCSLLQAELSLAKVMPGPKNFCEALLGT